MKYEITIYESETTYRDTDPYAGGYISFENVSKEELDTIRDTLLAHGAIISVNESEE